MATLVAENGKPRYEAELFELFYVLELTRYYTGRAGRRALGDELHHPFIFSNKRTRTVRHPRGVVGVIGPWNFPLLNNYGDCIGPLAAGNAVVLKPSDTTPLTSLRVGALWKSCGLPDGVLEVVAGRGDAGAALTAAADMIFFTGSPAVGKQVAATAAARLIPAVLELGGKSAMIVLADADLPRAARAAVWSGFAGSGQVCIRTERVLVEAPAADRLLALMTEEIGRLRQAAPGPRRRQRGDRRRRGHHLRAADRPRRESDRRRRRARRPRADRRRAPDRPRGRPILPAHVDRRRDAGDGRHA